jgi:hypothetical protein
MVGIEEYSTDKGVTFELLGYCNLQTVSLCLTIRDKGVRAWVFYVQ